MLLLLRLGGEQGKIDAAMSWCTVFILIIERSGAAAPRHWGDIHTNGIRGPLAAVRVSFDTKHE